MGRNKKYGESTTATSEARKAAQRAYYKRKKEAGGYDYQVLSITMNQNEYDASRATLAAHGLTPLQAWRRLMAELNAEPIPAPAELNPDTPPEPLDN